MGFLCITATDFAAGFGDCLVFFDIRSMKLTINDIDNVTHLVVTLLYPKKQNTTGGKLKKRQRKTKISAWQPVFYETLNLLENFEGVTDFEGMIRKKSRRNFENKLRGSARCEYFWVRCRSGALPNIHNLLI